MADNFLERQMEAYRNGKTVIRRANPSLDTLLRRLGEDTERTGDKVMQAQFDAVARSASALGCSEHFSIDASEARQDITVHGPSSPGARRIELGQVLLAMRLKAAELGISSKEEIQSESAAAAAGLNAVLKLFK